MATSDTNKILGARLRQRAPEPKPKNNLALEHGYLNDDYTGMQDFHLTTVYVNPLSAGGTPLTEANSQANKSPVPVAPVIEWDERGLEAANILIKTGDLLAIRKVFPEAYPHACMMYERLSYHREHFNKELPDPLHLVVQSLAKGAKFTEEYLDRWKLRRFAWMNMEFNQQPDMSGIEPLTAYHSDYFAYHFIFWKEVSEDYRIMMEDYRPPDPDALQRIEDIVAEMSSNLISDRELFEEPDPDYIWRPVATGGFTGYETKPEWEIEFDDPGGDIEEEILVCARSIAPKRPGETRDIGIMKPGSLRFHRRIMYPLKKACTKIRGCVYGRDANFIKQVVRRIGRKEYFYMRDYTKSGMTIPHEVQAAVFRGFYRRWPERGEAAARFFRDQQLHVKMEGGDWELMRPKTGSPLGLFVEGYTILQYAIHEMNLSEIEASSSHFIFSATNDDMVVGNDNKDELRAYNDADIRNNSELSMSYKASKSGLSHNRFVFCEEYWIDDDVISKESLFATSLIGAKFCFNSFHAKEYCYAVMLSAGEVTPRMQQAIHAVQGHHGHEFHEDEYRWPYLFGGWLPCIKDGLDHSIEWFNGDLKAIAAYWACRQRLSRKGKLDYKGHLGISRKYDVKLVAEPQDLPDWLDLVPVLGSKRALERHYRKSANSPKSVLREYELLSRFRRETYNRIIDGKQEFDSVYKDYIIRHPNTYWIDRPPGLVLRPSFTRVDRPRYGFAPKSFEMKLLMLQTKGVVLSNLSGKVRGTAMKLAHKGIINQCEYDYIPLAEEGISAKLLSVQPKGFLNFFERTGMVPISFSEDDGPLEPTPLWAYMPWASLQQSWVTLSYGLQRGYEKDLESYVALADLHKRMSKDKDPRNRVDSFDVYQPVEAHDRLLEETIRDVLRDWEPEVDKIMDEIRARILPPEHHNTQARDLAEAFARDEHAFEIRVRTPAYDGDSEIESGSDPDEIFDPWSELGYT